MNPTHALDCALFGGVFLLAGIVFACLQAKSVCRQTCWLLLGFPFVGAPLATFGMQHLLGGRLLIEVVPEWMPARLFWVYFVGIALIAAALSLTFQKYLRFSAPLLTLLFFLLAVLTDLPGSIAQPRQWIGWSMMLRELSYAAGALAIVSFVCIPVNSQWRSRIFSIARWILTITLVYFAIEQLLFPQYSPGVPDLLPTPVWVPVPRLLTYLNGVILILAAGLLLVRRYVRQGTVFVGAWMTILTIAIYTPTMLMKFGTPNAIEGVDFVFDTLLFGGTMLLLGYASSRQEPARDPYA